MKFLKLKSERNIILLCVVIAVLVPTLTYFYLSATRLKTQSRTDSKKNSPDTQETSLDVNNVPLHQVETEPIVISDECIFKPVKSLTPAERQFVLGSAREKLISVLKNKDTPIFSYMTIYTKPMTTTELEVLGDYILDQKNANQVRVHALKMAVYWNRKIAEASMAVGHNHGSLFYNSYWDAGKRGGGVENPKSLDDRGLYNYIVKHEFYALFEKPLEYDTINQVLYLEHSPRCMIELIFDTFHALGNGGSRHCFFDRLPNLQQVTIIYKDTEGNEIGFGNYDIHYWQSLTSIASFPFEVENDYSDKLSQLHLKYKSKLITEDEYHTQTECLRDVNNEQKHQYYQDKWLELFPLVANKDFQLNKHLPLTHKSFRF